jgi:PAH dioxygenase large subunit
MVYNPFGEPTIMLNLVNAAEGLVSARAFSDPEVYRAEQSRVFGRCWLFIGHESEIPNPGDFAARSMGEDPVILGRGRDGEIRVMLNVCRHRGRRLCAEDMGNANHFQCGYHGWTYSNTGELTGVPFFESYQGKLSKSEWSLIQTPRVDTYRGLIFASWDTDAAPLESYLGDMRWVLDLMFARTDNVRVIGPPQRWIVDCNWKLGAGNFGGDFHHLFTTHGFSNALGLKPTRVNRKAHALPMSQGHVASIVQFADQPAQTPFLALPPELWPEIERNLTPDQVQEMRPMQLTAGTVFPNLSFLNTASHTSGEWGGPDGEPISFLTLRQWQPRGPDKMEMVSWGFVDGTAPKRWQKNSADCYHRVFGMAGIFEQDDIENWSEINNGLRGKMAQDLPLNYMMALDMSPSTEWTGPGTAYIIHHELSEINERVMYERWRELMEDVEPLSRNGRRAVTGVPS